MNLVEPSTEVVAANPRSLPVAALLGLHAVIPVCVVIATVDALALDRAVAQVLPTHPDQLAGFTLIFNLPHIIASEMLLLDREYRMKYGRLALSVAAAMLLATATVPFFVSPRILFALLLAVTLVHVIGQQTGIAGMLAGLRGTLGLRSWRWGMTAVALMVYAPWTPGVAVTAAEREILDVGVWIGVVALTAIALVLHRRAKTTEGQAYLWSTHAVLVSLAGLSQAGYPCLALLVPRFVHDTTAWAFYLVHDTNRNRHERRNLVYRALGFTGLPVWLLGPFVAIGLAAMIQGSVPVIAAGVVVGVLSMVHYVLEAVTWRGAGLYRAWVPIAHLRAR